MSKTITLNLKRDLILEAVKTDSYITGQIDKSLDVIKNASMAYNEQAGDDNHHERKLIRTIRSAIAKFEANMAEFIDSSNGTITDTFASTSTSNPDFTITLVVSDRYNNGLAKPLSSLAEEYIINMTDYTWWQAIKPDLAKNYLAFAQDSLLNIRLCLSKKAPTASSADYTEVNGTVTNS